MKLFLKISPLIIFSFAASIILLQKQIQSTFQLLVDRKQVLGVESQQQTAMPKRLIIPKINVDSNIQYVGLTAKGEMGIPNNTVDVGWFNLGSRPGELGTSVIAGHFDSEEGKPGVFANLYKLKGGDKIYVKDNEGVTTTFIVRESRAYVLGHDDEVFNSINGSHLNLITCDGVWDTTTRSYSKRLVVFSDLAS